MLIEKLGFKIGVVVENDGSFTLVKGSKLLDIKNSLTQNYRDLRSKNASSLVVDYDVNFKSLSGLATYVCGSSKSGNVVFPELANPNAPKITRVRNKKPVGETENVVADENVNVNETENAVNVETQTRVDCKNAILGFCKDFEMTPDNRMLDNMLYVDNVRDYVVAFCSLVGMNDELVEQAKNTFSSRESENVCNTLKTLKPKHDRINKRLTIYYGIAGSGKTTKAIAEFGRYNENNELCNKIVASASADPDDMFTWFNPKTSQYELTSLGLAMVNGTPIIIDEANFYNTACLARLQGVLDNTTSIVDRGQLIEIKDGFEVIITMNLETNLGKNPLPLPLVSRAKTLMCFDGLDNALDYIW